MKDCVLIEKPLVSIIIPCYRQAEYISEAIESVISQTYDNWECIIIDDGSPDNTKDISSLYIRYDKRIKYIYQENQGVSNARNNGILFSRGKYILPLDADDIIASTYVEKAVSILESHPEYAVAGTLIQRFDEEGYWGTPGKGHKVSVKDIFQLRAFTHPSVMMRKTALTKVGGYTVSPLTMRSQDFDLWCKLYCNGFVGFNMDEILLDYYEKRNATKEVVFKYKYSLYKMMKYWRKKMRLPISYNYYAYRVLIKLLVPRFVLVLYKNNK